MFESMEYLEKALEVQLKALGEEHATVADTYSNWDGRVARIGNTTGHGVSAERFIHPFESVRREDHVNVGHSHIIRLGIQ